MSHSHSVVWLDHKEAKVFHIGAEGLEAHMVESPHHHMHRHPSTTREHKHPTESEHYYHEIARALSESAEILVVGPSTAKLEFIKHVHKHDHALEPKIVGVETVDHPTDGQLVAYAKRYFLAADRLR